MSRSSADNNKEAFEILTKREQFLLSLQAEYCKATGETGKMTEVVNKNTISPKGREKPRS